MNPLYDRLFAPHEGSSTPFLDSPGATVLSYGTFMDMVGRYANLLCAIGLKPGDRVAVQVAKTPEALALYGACVKAGLIFLPLNTAYTVDELAYFITDSGAVLIVCDPSGAEGLYPVAAAQGAQLKTLAADGSGTLTTAAQDHPATGPVATRNGGDLAALLYTSGTTGRSKGAMLTQDNLLSNALTLAQAWGFENRDILLHALPIFHTHGLFVATNVTLAVGASMIFMPRFDLDTLIDKMPDASVMMGVPTFYTRLLDAPGFDRQTARNMRLFISGSAPLLAETHTTFEARTGHRILERYGMTETNMNTSNPLDGDRRAGTVGHPLPGVEVRITDPASGAILPSGEVGGIEVRGPNVFAGYWNMPEKTAEELRADGFFITGDLGRIDSEGYLEIVGRQKDLIISGGYNIYPKEIELLLDEQPGVLESAVVGIPDADFGEAVIAYVVPSPNATVNIDDLRRQCQAQMARFKHPREYRLVTELPRNTMGKVQKALLRQADAQLPMQAPAPKRA